MRYFITHIIPRELLQDYNVPTALYNFSSNIITTGLFDKVFSLLPTNIYDYSGSLKNSDYEIIYSKIRNKYKIFRFLGAFVEEINLFCKIEKGSSLWLYNLGFFDVIYVTLLKVFKPSVRIFPIVLDFTPGERGNSIALPLINKADGIITLSNLPFFTVKNTCCLAGIVPEDNPKPMLHVPFARSFLISGNLDERISSLSMLLKAFSKMPDYQLHITGKPVNEQNVIDYSSKYTNIIYHGILSFSDYLSLLQRTPFILSTRDPKFPENKFNFPSKVIESFLYNRIIISTIHYNQLNEIKYFEIEHGLDTIIDGITKIAHLPDEELLLYANQSEMVKNNYSINVWKECVFKIEENTLK